MAEPSQLQSSGEKHTYHFSKATILQLPGDDLPEKQRASLMEAIRNVGGYSSASLKSVDGREILNHSTTMQLSKYMKEKKTMQEMKTQSQVKVKSRVPGGGNFMAELANKLRR